MDWTQGTPTDYIGEEMSISCFEYAENIKVKFFKGTGVKRVEVAEGVVTNGIPDLGAQGGTGTMESM